MNIWLMDTYDGLNYILKQYPDFNVHHTYLERCYEQTIGKKLPDPCEFDLVLIDFMNTADNQFRELSDEKEAQFAKARMDDNLPLPPKAILFQNPEFNSVNSYAVEVAQLLSEGLHSGTPLVVIAGEYSDYFKVYRQPDNYEWLCRLMPTLKVVSKRPSGPAPLHRASSDASVERLFAEFETEMQWEVSFNDPVEYFRMISKVPHLGTGYSPPKSTVVIPAVELLFQNTRGEPVSFTWGRGQEEVIVLPNVKDVHRRADYITYLLNDFLPAFRPQWFKERWAGSFITASIATKRARLERIKARLSTLIRLREEMIQNETEFVRSYIDLLTQTGDRLVSQVKRAFSEVFEMQVIDLDQERATEGKPKLFDLIISTKCFRATIEVKGKNGTINKEVLDQTKRNVDLYIRENPYEQFDAHIIVINHQPSRPPTERSEFAEERVKDAEKHGLTLLPTPTFMEMLVQIIEGKARSGDLLEILKVPGLIVL